MSARRSTRRRFAGLLLVVGAATLAWHDSSATAQTLPAQPTEAAAVGEDVGVPGEHPLRQVGTLMSDVQQRLRAQDTSRETLSVQQRIITQLAQLLAQQESKSSSQQNSSSRPVTPPDARPGERPGTIEGRGGTVTDGAGTANQTGVLVRQLWGHLPAQVRQQMETPLHEKFLPKYDNLIQDYFKRLAQDEPQ